uniref:Uncharacterized protein n=1 Tax=Oryza nivara TaxID=4536 RepID=A0A0E0FNU0_ORYNI
MASAAAVRSVAISLFVVALAVAAFACVPCTRKGASYYNCVPGAPPSPYNRSCEHITRCHG